MRYRQTDGQIKVVYCNKERERERERESERERVKNASFWQSIGKWMKRQIDKWTK